MAMMYLLKVWYAATPEDFDPPAQRLTKQQVEDFMRPEVGLMHDLLRMEGRGVRRVSLEADTQN